MLKSKPMKSILVEGDILEASSDIKNKINIVVPSRERATWLKDNDYTLSALSTLPKDKANVYLFIRDDDSELDVYREYVKNLNKVNNIIQLIIYKPILNDEPIYGAAQTYDMIIDLFGELGYDKIITIDDDQVILAENPYFQQPHKKRDNPYYAYLKDHELNTFFIRARYELLYELLKRSMQCVDGSCPLAAYVPVMSRSVQYMITFCKPIVVSYIIDLEFFRTHPEFRYWQGKHIEARCDLNITLRLLTSGYLVGWHRTLFTDYNLNNPGGCSVYRTLNVEHESIEHLKKMFPGFVRTRMKKGWLNDQEVMREAPVIQFKKAFNSDQFKKRFNMSGTAKGAELNQRLIRLFNEIYAGDNV